MRTQETSQPPLQPPPMHEVAQLPAESQSKWQLPPLQPNVQSAPSLQDMLQPPPGH